MDSDSIILPASNQNIEHLDSPSQPNRKWLGAMALMQLASNDDATEEGSSELLTPATMGSQPIVHVVMDRQLIDTQQHL